MNIGSCIGCSLGKGTLWRKEAQLLLTELQSMDRLLFSILWWSAWSTCHCLESLESLSEGLPILAWLANMSAGRIVLSNGCEKTRPWGRGRELCTRGETELRASKSTSIHFACGVVSCFEFLLQLTLNDNETVSWMTLSLLNCLLSHRNRNATNTLSGAEARFRVPIIEKYGSWWPDNNYIK